VSRIFPRTIPLLIALLLALPTAQAAAPITIVASVPPVHALVAGVMEGVGTPHLLIRGGATPHAGALRPSDARRLQDARAVFWIGEGLETYLTRPLASLTRQGRVIALMGIKDLRLLPFREGENWDKPADHLDHDHQGPHGIDAHIWLDPGNAKILVRAIAGKLKMVDPTHAARYTANAIALQDRIDALDQSLTRLLAPLRGVPYIVFHDAYQYFERHFGLMPAGAIALSPTRAPGARHLQTIRDRLRSTGARCVFVEPQFTPRLASIIIEGTGAKIATLDPLGAALRPGKDTYFTLMQNLATALSACLNPKP
jgi:zinc transport system substrate-binding protein